MKRLFDLIAVCAILPVMVLPACVIALLIKIDSLGPILFRQERVGMEGKRFKMFKFRTMVRGAERMGTSVTTGIDPRITPWGRILRRTKLDELPQLINVLKGDMSLVGPRPEVPEMVQNYTSGMKEILKIKPGITSLATLHMRNEQEMLSGVSEPERFYIDVLVPFKVELAMEHVRRDSFSYDLGILAKTLWMLSLGRWWPIKAHSRVARLQDDIMNGISRPQGTNRENP